MYAMALESKPISAAGFDRLWGAFGPLLVGTAPPMASAGTDYLTGVSQNRALFTKHADRWRRETAHMSSAEDICEHESYRAIVQMGQKAIPYILDELTTHPAQWFDALSEITGDDPIPDNEHGKMKFMVSRWLDWGAQNGWIND